MGKFVDLTGIKFNRLTVRQYYGQSKHKCALWLCDCDCGKTTIVRTADLKNGHTKSCGCLFIETSISKLPDDVSGVNNPNYKHGGCYERLYNVWCGIKDRCNNPNKENYGRYGAMGITICPEWENDYPAFREWALTNGYVEELSGKEMSIDRIDSNQGYSPDNCQWVTLSENVARRNYDYWETVHANQR